MKEKNISNGHSWKLIANSMYDLFLFTHQENRKRIKRILIRKLFKLKSVLSHAQWHKLFEDVSTKIISAGAPYEKIYVSVFSHVKNAYDDEIARMMFNKIITGEYSGLVTGLYDEAFHSMESALVRFRYDIFHNCLNEKLLEGNAFNYMAIRGYSQMNSGTNLPGAHEPDEYVVHAFPRKVETHDVITVGDLFENFDHEYGIHFIQKLMDITAPDGTILIAHLTGKAIEHLEDKTGVWGVYRSYKALKNLMNGCKNHRIRKKDLLLDDSGKMAIMKFHL